MEFTQEIFDRINSFDTIKAGCQAIAAETGYDYNEVRNKYYYFRNKNTPKYSHRRSVADSKRKDILLEISKHPDNLKESFRIVAKKYNTTWNAIQTIYYGELKNNPNNPVFTLVSKKLGHMNVKNNINNRYPKHKTNHSFIEQTWGKIKYFINNILK